MSDLTVSTFTSTTGTRSIDFTSGNLIVSNNAGGTLVNMSATSLTVTGSSSGNGIDIRNNSANATTVGMPNSTEANSINLKVSQGTYALTLSTTTAMRNLDFTGFSGSLFNNPSLNIYGDLTLASTMTSFASGSSAWTFASTSATERLITTNNKSVTFPFTFNGVGGSWKIVGTLDIGARTITLTNGTIDFNNQTIIASASPGIQTGTGTSTIRNLSTTAFLQITNNGIINMDSNNTVGPFGLASGRLNFYTYSLTATTVTWSGAGAKTLDFGASGKIVVNNNAGGTVVTGTATGFTLLGTNPLIECTGGTSGGAITKSIGTGNQTESTAISYSLIDTSSLVTYSFTGSTPNAVKNLLVNGTQRFNNTALTIFGNYTYDDSSGTKITAFNSGINAWTFARTSGSGTIDPGTSTNVPGSVYFNGTDDTLSIPYNANQALTNQDFTIEGWVFPTASGTPAVNVVNTWYGVGGQYRLRFDPTTGRPSFAYTIGGDTQVSVIGTTTSVTRNAWNHLAVVRNSGTITLYVNGVADATTGSIGTTSIIYRNSNTKDIRIGSSASDNQWTTGYISDVRQVIGVAVYTGNFTPPRLAHLGTSGASSAAAYPSTANVNTTFSSSATNLLTCQSPVAYVDDSNNSFTVSAIAGNPVPSNFGLTQQLYDFPWTFDGAGGSWTLQNPAYVGIARTMTLTNGTVDLNGKTLSAGSFATTAGTKGLTFNGGKLEVTGSGATAYNNAVNTGFTITKGTGTGTISLTSIIDKTFVGGGITYPITLDQGGSGNLTVADTNTFDNLSGSVTTGASGNVLFPPSATTTFTNFTAAGSGTNRLGIYSSTTNTRWNLNITNGSIFNTSSLSIRDCNPDLSTGQRYIALLTNNNVNAGNNVYWTFGNESMPMFG